MSAARIDNRTFPRQSWVRLLGSKTTMKSTAVADRGRSAGLRRISELQATPCAMFFLSGAAALIFATLWFRQAGLSFGNSMWASSLVLAGFMAGTFFKPRINTSI